MNDLIKELAEDAGYKHPKAVGECEDYAYFNHEKFARLIIEECVDYAFANGDNVDYLIEYFGVE